MNAMGITTLFARKQMLGIVSLLGLSASLTLSQIVIQSASFAQTTNSQSRSSFKKLSGHINLNRYSGAESGVQLLDHIFNRVSNIPQVASIQNQVFTQTQQRLQNKDSVGKDGIDYKLAIRPKETGKPFANITPSLQISVDKASPLLAYDQGAQLNSRVQQSLAGAAVPAEEESRDARAAKLLKKTADIWRGNSKVVQQQGSSEAAFGDEGSSGVWDRESSSADQLANEVSSFNSMAMQESKRRAPAKAQRLDTTAFVRPGASTPSQTGLYSAGNSYVGGGGAGGTASARAGGLPPTNMGKYVRQGQGADQYLQRGQLSNNSGGTAGNRLKQQGVNVYSAAAEAQTRMPELANSLSKFYNINKGLEDVQQYSERIAQASPSAPSPTPLTVSTSSKKKASYYSAPREIQIVDERPAVRDFREAPKVALVDAAPLPTPTPASPSVNAPKNSPSPSPTSVSGSLMRRMDSDAKRAREIGDKSKSEVAQKESNYKDADSVEKKRDMLALLPPNVATGIPLVSLGTSQNQAMSALSAIGQLKEQKIGKWTVLTWKKKDSNYTALQLFFRHGLLDAMRIFDQSLIAPDFGAAPGANLEAVKARFGEPAFLLPEPIPGIGQNYVYPISQVGFQFARPEKDSAPQVVSVLIFSVK